MSQENVEIVRAAYDAFNRGHRDARFTFRVYQRAAKRRERLAGEHLAAFDRALEWAGMGREHVPDTVADQPATGARSAGNRAAKLESVPARL